MFDVAIVGAGFVGNFVGSELAKKGYRVVIFEEHKEIGFPPHCAGLVGISGLERLGLRNKVLREGLVINEIRGARFFSKRGKYFEIHYAKPVAWVIDREGIDKLLYTEFVSEGGIGRLGIRINEIYPDGTLVATKSLEKFRAQVVVDAEGARRALIRNFPGVYLAGLLPAIQIDVKSRRKLESDFVEIHFNVPDFFSWVIPLDNQTYRVGVASNFLGNRMLYFIKRFAKRRLGEMRIIKTFGGIVVSGPPLKRMVWGQIIAVGDAAGQTKPTTGGGVVMGGLSAKIAAGIIDRYISTEGEFSLENYERVWRRILGNHLRIMLHMKRIMVTFSNLGILTDILFSMIPRGLGKYVGGDFDFHSTLIIPWLK
ncbi:MAG: FAD-dependent monooxygenase [Candidatus Njordarchaeales archaeon]